MKVSKNHGMGKKLIDKRGSVRMKKAPLWSVYAADHRLREKSSWYRKNHQFCKRNQLCNADAGRVLAEGILSGRPLSAGRIGLFELAAMRMCEFGIEKKYQLVMDNIYNCAGFFPNDVALLDPFLEEMKSALQEMDYLAPSEQFLENYFINHYTRKEIIISENFELFEICKLKEAWTPALKDKKVLVVTPFAKTVEAQYKKREFLFQGTDILPEFQLLTYQALMTIGELRDDRFDTWFDALAFMEKEILALDFDIALLGCGAYGFPLAARIKKAGKQAVHMGGILQILFGIMGKRWDGSGTYDIVKIRDDIAPYYNEYWTYPLEEKPSETSKVEYGPYWS